MRTWLQTLALRLSRWMYGRYGTDELNRVLLIAGMVLALVSLLPFLWLLWPVGLGLMVWANIRTFSRNIPKRQAELQTYWRLKNRLKTAVNLRRRMWQDRRTHRFVKCRHCRAVLRIPRGRGTVEVGCPRCHATAAYRS